MIGGNGSHLPGDHLRSMLYSRIDLWQVKLDEALAPPCMPASH